MDPGLAILRAQAEGDRRRQRLAGRRFLPGGEGLAAEVEDGLGDEAVLPRSRQVSVRLRRDQWERLLEAARLSGVRPTTMARILINRGAKALLDEEDRHRRRFGWEADG